MSEPSEVDAHLPGPSAKPQPTPLPDTARQLPSPVYLESDPFGPTQDPMDFSITFVPEDLPDPKAGRAPGYADSLISETELGESYEPSPETPVSVEKETNESTLPDQQQPDEK